jgi:ADP-ribosylglycohydrolase
LLINTRLAKKRGNARQGDLLGTKDTADSLRAVHVTVNEAARRENLAIFENMRVPEASIIHRVFHDVPYGEAVENLSSWKTSKENALVEESRSFQGEPKIMAIARGEYRNKPISEIRGTGYVVRSLEAALWCFLHTETFEAAILKAANLGDDADTTAAVCGQIAGAFYGESGIPKKWLERLAMRQEISTLADRLFEANQ